MMYYYDSRTLLKRNLFEYIFKSFAKRHGKDLKITIQPTKRILKPPFAERKSLQIAICWKIRTFKTSCADR